MSRQWSHHSIVREEGCTMAESFDYNSIFAPYFQAFIKMKEDLGHQALRTKWILLEFDRFFESIGTKDLYITSAMIDRWRGTRNNDGERTLCTKYATWSQFTRYMCRVGQECHIPRVPKNPVKIALPPIFSRISRLGRSSGPAIPCGYTTSGCPPYCSSSPPLFA